ncbi:MAG: Gfo/Idh/MocA family protein [Neptuniibacter sp.]
MKSIGVIGFGSISKRHRANLKLLFPDSQVIGVSSSGRIPEEKISDCDRIVDGITGLIAEQVDFAIVASPASFHVEHSIPLIQSGIPVLIEKPVAVSTSDVGNLVAAVKGVKAQVAVGYCLRYLPSAGIVKELLREGKIGTIYHASVEVGQYLPDWRSNKDHRKSVSANRKLGGGALLELSHEIDYARWLFGELNVRASILRSSDTLKLEVEDSVDLLATSQNGAVISIHLDLLQRAAFRKCRISGSEGALEWDLINNSITLIKGNGVESIYAELDWDKNGMYLEMIRDFIRYTEGEQNQCIKLEDAVGTLSVIEQVRELSLVGTK